MVSKQVKVINEQGIHMRPASMLVKAASAHKDCSVTLKTDGKEIKATALLSIMSAGIKGGAAVEIVCDGENEKAVLDEITGMFENGFGE